MKQMLKLTAFGIGLGLTFAPPTWAQVWPAGEEREVDAGLYATVVQEADGWRLWRFESREGIHCKAVKPAIGNIPPLPSGSGDMLRGSLPFVEVTRYSDGKLVWNFEAVFPRRSTTQYRKVGDRFFELYMPRDHDLSRLDGEQIEVNVISYEYPTIFVGRTETGGKFDLSGMANMIDAVDECEGNGPRPPSVVRRQGPKPLGRPSRWFTTDDLPSAALAEGLGGRVKFALKVGTDGRVTDCTITETTGSPAIGDSVCGVLAKRARFSPALNEGEPVIDSWESEISWTSRR